MSSEKKLDFNAKLENLRVVSNFLEENLRAFGLNEREIFQIKLAVDEMITNTIMHGYKLEGGCIRLKCYDKDNKIIIILEDKSQPFNPLDAPEPDLESPLEEREVGGLGIHLLKVLVDEVYYEFEEGINRLTIIKNKKK